MGKNNAYESCCMRDVLGETLRPGGFILTDKAAEYCKLSKESHVLDMGCGRGATVGHLFEKYGITAVGVDPSEKLLNEAKERFDSDAFVLGRGENLPFEDGLFDCAIAECTLSLMDAHSAAAEAWRVLKKGGFFVVTDVYAKNSEAVGRLSSFPVNSCMRGLHDLTKLRSSLEQLGFTVEYFEECSQYLKELVVRIGFSYGSMCEFWNMASGSCINGEEFYGALKRCRPGYFMLIAKKGEKQNEQ